MNLKRDARVRPEYPTRAEFEAGARPIAAVPRSLLLKLMTGKLGHMLDRWFVRYTGLSFISWEASRSRGIAYQPSLLLVVRGRRSGRSRSVVLPYVAYGDEFIVIASNAGRTKSPAWVANLIAEPCCRIVINRSQRMMHARLTFEDERDRLMDIVAEQRPQVYNYDQIVRAKGRRLEIVVLSPMMDAAMRQ